jgi:hypothetical protein
MNSPLVAYGHADQDLFLACVNKDASPSVARLS